MPTHGSLTKAGKVRAQTPKVVGKKPAKNSIPRRSNRSKYLNRIVNNRETDWRRRRRRRRR